MLGNRGALTVGPFLTNYSKAVVIARAEEPAIDKAISNAFCSSVSFK